MIGAITGIILYSIYTVLLPLLGLTSSPGPVGPSQPKSSPFTTSPTVSNGAPRNPGEAGRTVADFRAERRRKKGEIAPADFDVELSPTSHVLGDSKGKWHRRGMLESPTILEEEDSDF